MRRILVLLLILIATAPTAAFAIQEATPQPEWRYEVSGVRADSALNVRAQAGTDAAIIGELAADATDVVVTGVRRPWRGSVWWEIVWPAAESGYAWVNARYLTPVAPHEEREAGFALACSGTEPFWSLRIADGEAQFDRMDGERETWQAGAWNPAGGRWGTFAVRLDVPSGEQPGHAAIQRDFRFCSDGMSEFQYPYDVLLITPDETVLSGCCRRRH